MDAIRITIAAGARMPTRAHPGDAGLDLSACEDTWVPAGECVLVRTGVCPHISTTMRDEHGRAECFTCGARVGPDRVEDADPEAR